MASGRSKCVKQLTCRGVKSSYLSLQEVLETLMGSTCPDCRSPMWLVVPYDAAPFFECFHCPDKPPEPEREGVPEGLRNGFGRVKHLWWQTGNRPLCDGEHIGRDGVFRKYSFSTKRPGATGPMSTDATRHYSVIYCLCGHANAVQKAPSDNMISFFCTGCGHSLADRSGDVRLGLVAAVPSRSLRDI